MEQRIVFPLAVMSRIIPTKRWAENESRPVVGSSQNRICGSVRIWVKEIPRHTSHLPHYSLRLDYFSGKGKPF